MDNHDCVNRDKLSYFYGTVLDGVVYYNDICINVPDDAKPLDKLYSKDNTDIYILSDLYCIEQELGDWLNSDDGKAVTDKFALLGKYGRFDGDKLVESASYNMIDYGYCYSDFDEYGMPDYDSEYFCVGCNHCGEYADYSGGNVPDKCDHDCICEGRTKAIQAAIKAANDALSNFCEDESASEHRKNVDQMIESYDGSGGMWGSLSYQISAHHSKCKCVIKKPEAGVPDGCVGIRACVQAFIQRVNPNFDLENGDYNDFYITEFSYRWEQMDIKYGTTLEFPTAMFEGGKITFNGCTSDSNNYPSFGREEIHAAWGYVSIVSYGWLIEGLNA